MWRAICQMDSILWPTFVALRPHDPVFTIGVRRIWTFWFDHENPRFGKQAFEQDIEFPLIDPAIT